jgi:hypothetical protein
VESRQSKCFRAEEEKGEELSKDAKESRLKTDVGGAASTAYEILEMTNGTCWKVSSRCESM